MACFQVVEKDDYGTDWAAVRYNEKALTRFESEEEAVKAAFEYITDRNCNNALTKAEKRNAVECFMMTKEGCFLGILDKEPWYMLDRHNESVDAKYYELEGRTQVAVRPLPGT